MKKSFIAFTMLLCFCSVLTFSACNETSDSYESQIAELQQRIEALESSDSDIEYNKIELTEENYSQYLAVSVSYSNCLVHYVEDDILGDNGYDLSCIITIETSAATNCYFESVTIFYNDIYVSGWNIAVIGRANVDCFGNSSVSFFAYKTIPRTSRPIFPTLQSYDITISSINGHVLVPTELQ